MLGAFRDKLGRALGARGVLRCFAGLRVLGGLGQALEGSLFQGFGLLQLHYRVSLGPDCIVLCLLVSGFSVLIRGHGFLD